MKDRYFMQIHLRQYRFIHNEMTQQELAERVGVTRQTILSIEKDRYRPSVDLAIRIARVFNVKVEDIFQIEEQQDEE